MYIIKIDQKTNTHKLGLIPSIRVPPTVRWLKLIGHLTGIVIILGAMMAIFRPPVPGNGAELGQTTNPTPQLTSWISPDINEPFLLVNPLLTDKGAIKYWGV